MRAAFVMVALSSAFCVMAQDPVNVPGPAKPGLRLVPWFAPSPQGAEVVGAQSVAKARIEPAGRPAEVCAVKLVEMPIPKDREFTMRTTRPPKIDEGIFVAPPAPACP